MSTSANRAARLLAAAAGLMLSACAVGPNFHSPAPPTAGGYGPARASGALAGDGAVQTLAPDAAVDPAWWTLFGSPDLNGLVEQGLARSPTLAGARAALDQSRDLARAGAGVFLPSAAGAFSAVRERPDAAQLGQKAAVSTFSLYTLSGAVTYSLDLFGGERRAYEALSAQAAFQRHALAAARLTLTGSVADAAIARAGYAEEAAALADIVRLEAGQLEIAQSRYRAGAGAYSAVLTAQAQLSADQTDLAGARQRLAATVSLLKALLGREAGEDLPPAPGLAALAVPAAAPVALPAQLVRERPDILQAQDNLHQASAQVGVATAALLPSVSLSGQYGAASTVFSQLTGPAGRFWSIGPTADVPIFKGGALWFQRKAARAAFEKAKADYRATVLAALQQTADQLQALDADASASEAQRQAFDAARANLDLARANLSAGVIAEADAMSLRIAERRAWIGLAAARTQRLQDVVGLYLASGGGWRGDDGGAAR